MKLRTWENIVDRSDWPAGPWDSEPDKIQWQDEVTGFPCLAVRNGTMGHWCGYVGVAPGHPFHGREVHGVASYVVAHGGVTFAASCAKGAVDGVLSTDEGRQGAVCHDPDPGEPADIWWLGFDCSHFEDVQPGCLRLMGLADYFVLPSNIEAFSRRYRDLDYVKQECATLARQLSGYEVSK